MPHYHKPRHKKKHSKKRSAIGRFFLGIHRIIRPPFVALFRVVKGDRGWKDWLKIGVLTSLIGAVSLGLIGIITIAIFSKDLPKPDTLIDRQIAQSTKIYDRTGEELLYEITGDKKRTMIKLEDLPEYVPQALIALEDKTFYTHSGFNYERIAKAILFKLLGKSSGGGASTLTNQLVKNAILTPEQTITRKLKEFILVFQIERKFDKAQILQMYFNEVPYGSSAYGIDSAANLYFDKHAADLTLAESAVLAAIIQRPTYLWNNQERLLDRKDLALRLMNEQGYITEDEKEIAQSEEIVFAERIEEIIAPHFVFYVREKLVEKYGEHMVNEGGLVVKTTLDLEKQKMAEEIISERAETNLEYGASNAALLSINPTNGEILSMVGSADYFNDEIDGQVNVTTRPRQPGSSLKPFVYTLGWLRGYTPSTILFDVETTFPGSGRAYQPKNYDLSQRGPISLRKSLQGSLNVTAVKMLYLLGVSPFLDFVEELGYSTFGERDRFGLSLVLGGGEVTLLDHTSAYATLAADGIYHEPLAILEVKLANDQILDTFEREGKRVLDENAARITSNVLSDNGARAFVFGGSNVLTLPGRPVAAKTGTTNDYRDAWTMGYTPSLATGVWGGNNDFSEMKRGAGGSVIAGPIWQSYMRQAMQGEPVEFFGTPSIPIPEKAILSGQSFGMKQVTIDKASEKLATGRTPDNFKEERLYIEAHTILHYITKKNPTGPAPTDPAAADSQYQKWEDAVQGWIAATLEKNEPIFSEDETQTFPENIAVVYGLPPIEEDNLHIPENQPSLTINSPSNDDKLESRKISISVAATAPRGISRVEFYFDNILIGRVSNPPFDLNTSLKAFPNGFYNLKVLAFDDIDNVNESSIRLQLQSEESYIKINWQGPSNGSTFTVGEGVIALQLEIESPDPISQVTIFEEVDGEQNILEALIAPSNGVLEVLWDPNNSGDYKIFSKLSVEGNGIISSPQINIKIIDPPIEEEEPPAE